MEKDGSSKHEFKKVVLFLRLLLLGLHDFGQPTKGSRSSFVNNLDFEQFATMATLG